ncbi:leucine--tRNA ligase [Candidatus Peregrinibacteria bacterium]|nr:leucine--tRNA ligase [Candidatus Peregrinibacteria bacterium]
MEKYDVNLIEAKWQDKWEQDKLYSTPDLNEIDQKNKLYVLPQLPYPSGSGLHVGHAEVYTSCDIYARYKRMEGKKVLQVIGWDSFGLPAENYAIKNNVHPKQTIEKAVENFTYQIKRMGISVDWDRSVGSHEPGFYKWTQWFFLLMYKRNLAYRKEQKVNWCESCKTVLANEQVTDGACERCGTNAEQKLMEQWYLRITEYADRLFEDLDKLDWPAETIKRQKDWIGKSVGAEIEFSIDGSKEVLRVFTTRPDTIFGATFMVIAPEHEIIEQLKEKIQNIDEIRKYASVAAQKTDLERQMNKDKSGVRLNGVEAINPVNGHTIPIFVADYVLSGYGTGAIMSVPAHDERDFEFARKFGLEIIPVISGGSENEAHTGHGILINSDFLDGLEVDQAKNKTIDWLEENERGEAKTTFKLRDWSISRQRFWGAPIPMLYDQNNELQPVDEADLPVLLPDDVDFMPTGRSPLTYSEKFHDGIPEGWRREVDTLDTFMCSSWYYYRYLDPHNSEAFASREALDKFMPVDFYIGGREHVNGHLLYSRFFTKVLYDAGYIDFDEPFTMHRHQGLILGEDNRKMSKRWGNIINPTDVMDRHGADTLRMYEMFMGPLEEDKAWNLDGEKGVFRFVNKIWGLQSKVLADFSSAEQMKEAHRLIKKVGADIEALSFNTSIAKFMEFSNFLSREEKIDLEVWKLYLLVMAPFAPYITEELWHRSGEIGSIHLADWPLYDESLLVESEISIVVQVNGKLRGEVKVAADASPELIKEKARSDENVAKYLAEGEIIKEIYVPGKLVNFVVKS